MTAFFWVGRRPRTGNPKDFRNFTRRPVFNLKRWKTNLHNPGEALWRRKLSEAGRNALRAQPELELEARLTAALAKIPDAPVPSNFTARVLAAIELDEARRRGRAAGLCTGGCCGRASRPSRQF